MITKMEEFMLKELKIMLINKSNYNYLDIKNFFINQCEEYIEWLDYSKKRFNKDYSQTLDIIKIVQANILLDEYENALKTINKFMKVHKPFKYIVYGDEVPTNRGKGNIDYVSPDKLMKLYKVNPKDCKIVNDKKDLFGFDLNKYNLIELRPRIDGNYTIEVND